MAVNQHDHLGDSMIMGGPACTRGCSAQGSRGPAGAPGVLLDFAGAPACGVLPVSASLSLSVCLSGPTQNVRLSACLPVDVDAKPHHATPRHATPRHAKPRQATPSHAKASSASTVRPSFSPAWSASSYAARTLPDGPRVLPSVAMMLVCPSPLRNGFTMRNTTYEYRLHTQSYKISFELPQTNLGCLAFAQH
jgi:hypothetical protein